MISITKVVIRCDKQWNPQTVEWREATAQMNKTPDTMNMDLGQNILEKSLLIYLWGKGQLSLHPTCPEKDAQISPYAHSYLQNCIKTEKIPDHVHLHSSFFYIKLIHLFLEDLFIPLHLSLPGRPKTPYFHGFNEKTFGQANQ